MDGRTFVALTQKDEALKTFRLLPLRLQCLVFSQISCNFELKYRYKAHIKE